MGYQMVTWRDVTPKSAVKKYGRLS